MRLESVKDLERAAVRALITQSIAISKPMGGAPGHLVIRAVSPKQRPRR
jgi:hypothetical protein